MTALLDNLIQNNRWFLAVVVITLALILKALWHIQDNLSVMRNFTENLEVQFNYAQDEEKKGGE
jgi:hypothetical protein